ncbi:SIMPL domain-containing protein [Histidinibacterium aquaticum]|uniref:SIMPL domain-containing protein n=1 Tax=Histidinibacterium aquaticum TaxID=2613962 RepID=UPI00168C0204|nr:SIMPL domain-containing protein [Histidinibacterium aquaticum]
MVNATRAACAALATTVLLAGPAAAQVVEPPALQVTGQGEVNVKPDMAVVRLGVRVEAETAEEAVDRMSAGTEAVLSALSQAGVADADISTGTLRVDPILSSYESREGMRVTGFAAEIGLSVTVRDLDDLGGVLDAVVRQGANRVDGVSFDLADRSEALAEARRAAVADAQAKAQVFAEAAGVRLGDLMFLTEGQTGGGGPQPMMMDARMESVPVPAGEMTISAQVSLSYSLSGE